MLLSYFIVPISLSQSCEYQIIQILIDHYLPQKFELLLPDLRRILCNIHLYDI